MTIYGLKDPRTKKIRYVGITVQKLEVRLSHHIYSAKRNSHFGCSKWIRELLEIGLEPITVVLEETTNKRREKHWIEKIEKKYGPTFNERCNAKVKAKKRSKGPYNVAQRISNILMTTKKPLSLDEICTQVYRSTNHNEIQKSTVRQNIFRLSRLGKVAKTPAKFTWKKFSLPGL